MANTGSPHAGNWHLLLTGKNSTATRTANVNGVSGSRLQFFYKASNWQLGHTATVEVYNGTAWQTVFTITAGEADGVYRFVDLDLSGIQLTIDFDLRFSTQMADSANLLYVDEVRIA